MALKAENLLRIRLPRQRFILWHDDATLSIVSILHEFGLEKIPPKVICDMIHTAVDFRDETKKKNDVEEAAKRFMPLLEMCDHLKTKRVAILRMLCLSDIQDARVNLSSAFQCHQKNSVWLNVSDVTFSLYTLARKYSEMEYYIEATKLYQHFLDKTGLKDDGDLLRKKASTYVWLTTNQPNDATTEKAMLTLQRHAKQSPSDLYAKCKLARYLYDLNRFDEAESVARSVIMDYKIAYKGENVHDLTAPLDTLCLILRRKDDDAYCDEYIAVSNRSFTISLEQLAVCATTASRLRNLAIAVRCCRGD